MIAASDAISAATRQALDSLVRQRVPERLRERDHTVWRPDSREIADRLGWLDAGGFLRPHLPDLTAFVNEICGEGYRDVVLLGMGGSSLGPEVLRRSFLGSHSIPKGNPRLTLLDSTVPGQVAAVTRAIDPAHTLFIVSSKSGGTIETMSLYRHFRELTENSLSILGKGASAGANFVAITDAGTMLERLGSEAGFRRVFLNPADIGGRYSVLSWFGMLPAALAGIDVARLLDSAAVMRGQCLGDDVEANPGLQLGALLGAMTLAGRDKVTLITPPPIDSFGLWVEQMIAESLGKEGRGLIPVAGEPLLSPDCYGDDRLFVYLRTGESSLSHQERAGVMASDEAVERLEAAGQPVARLELPDRHDLGAEFFRWEYATAIAGSMLDVHPFDQPDVQGAKDNTDSLLQAFLKQGSLPELPTVHLAEQPIAHPPEQPPEQSTISLLEQPAGHPSEQPARHPAEQPTGHPEPVEGAVASLLKQAGPGDYLAIISYMPADAEADRLLDELRAKIMERSRIATTAGYGPRYLHSTGQLHKGGPDSGLYLQLITGRNEDLPIPGQPYGFDVLAAAQAIGDYQALTNLGRRLVSVNLGDDPIGGLRRLLEEF